MKKMFLASCLLAASVFAAPEAATAAPATTAAPSAQPEANATAAAPAVTEAPKTEAQVAAPAAEAPKAEAQVAAPAAEAAPTEAVAPAAEAPKAEAPAEAKAEAQEQVAPAAEVSPAPEATAAAEPAPAAEAATAEAQVAAPAAEAAPAEAVAPAAEAPKAEAQVAAPAPEKKPAKKKRKKKKMIERAVVETAQLAFDIQADFEMEAGKVFWSSEKDGDKGDNLETWTGQANFAVLAEGEDFKGKIGVTFYPGDLVFENDYATKKQKKDAIHNDSAKTVADYFEVGEAWAMQNTDYFVFKVGRWDNTDKNGDYFGSYVDGYMNGFLSTHNSENQLQFGFTPTDNMEFNVSLISGSPNLNKGDVRAAFNFQGLEGLSDLKVQLAYRSNVFDKIYDSDAEIVHNASLKAKLPLVKNVWSIFGEAALMNIDPNDDMIMPLTGGFIFYTPVVDRIIIEAEYVKDRQDTDFGYDASSKQKHVKDVLGAIYLEKAFTDRFSLSAGFHSFGSTKDYMLSGNLVGRIN